MEEYTKEIGFWKRLHSFVSDVQTNCCMGEEEKQMIIHCCKLKMLEIHRVGNRECDFCGQPAMQGETHCEKCSVFRII